MSLLASHVIFNIMSHACMRKNFEPTNSPKNILFFFFLLLRTVRWLYFDHNSIGAALLFYNKLFSYSFSMITLLQSLQQWHYEILISTTTTTNTIANNIATTFTTSSTCNSTANISKRRSSSESKRSSEETTIMNAPAPAPAPATTPMNLEEARQALPLLCSTCSATKNWNLIMDLFQKWPNLLLQVLDIPLPALAKAAETAEQKKEQAASSKSTASTATSASCYPLTLLVAHQAPLHIIQSLCCAIRQHLLHSQNQLQLQPNKLKPNIYQEEYQSYDLQITQALQVACSVQVACSSSSLVEATIVYLTQQCPQAVQHTDSNGNLPLHNVTNNQFQHATLPTMQALIEPFPESILLLPSNNSNNKGTTPLQNIIHYGYDLNIVQYVVDQLQGQGHVSADTHTHKQNRNLHFNFGFHPFNHKRAVALSLLLPKLQSLTCYPSKWTWEGLCTLLQAIQQQHQQNNNTSITQLHLKGVPRNFFTANLRIQNALQECLYHNQETLQHLTIQVQNSWYDKNRQSDKQFLQDIANLMMKNQNYHCTKMEWYL